MKVKILSNKSKTFALQFEPKDMLAICTAMFVFSVALSTLLQTTFVQTTDLAKSYAGLIIVLIGVPFGLCALITALALVLNSQKIWHLSKYGLVISSLCLLLTIIWIGLGVYLQVSIEIFSNTFTTIAGVSVLVGFFIMFLWASWWAEGEKAQIMKAFGVLRNRANYFENIVWIESPSTTYLGRNILRGEPNGSGGYNLPSIQGWNWVILKEKDLSKSDFEGMSNQEILIIIENKQVINTVVPLIKEMKGNIVGCLIVNQEVITSSTLEILEKKFGFPVTSVKKKGKEKNQTRPLAPANSLLQNDGNLTD